MRKTWLLLGSLIAAFTLHADVAMRLTVPRPIYMQYEPVTLTLTMRNTSGQALIFGSEAEFKGSMGIEVTDVHARPVKGNGNKINLRGLILKSGVDHTIRINLSKWLNITRQGTYRIKLYISHPMLKHEYESNMVVFEVSAGKIFWSKEFGLPKIDTSKLGEPSPLRTYNLKALQDKSDVYFFLFIEDDEKIYAIKKIGMLLGRENPKCEIDSINRFHILLPLSPRVFHHMVFDWNGKIEVSKVYRTTNEIPVLFRNPSTGEVKVVGGAIAKPGVDYSEENLSPDSKIPIW